MQIITDKIILEILPGKSYYLASKDESEIDRISLFLEWEQIPATHQALLLAIHEIIKGYLQSLERLRGEKAMPINPFFDTAEIQQPKKHRKK